MTYTVTPEILQWPCFLKYGSMQILTLLLARTDDTGSIRTDIHHISDMLRISEVIVRSVINDLIQQGVISMDCSERMSLIGMPKGIQPITTTPVSCDPNVQPPVSCDQSQYPPTSPTPPTHDRKRKAATEKKDTRFIKPTEEEVRAYITLKGYHFSAEEFIAHYESNGWRVGKNPMKKWQAACVTFERTWKRDQERYQQRLNTQHHAKLNNYQQQQYAARQAYVNATAQTNVCDDTTDSLLLPGM